METHVQLSYGCDFLKFYFHQMLPQSDFLIGYDNSSIKIFPENCFQKLSLFTNHLDVFRNLPTTYDEAFLRNQLKALVINYFHSKTQSQILGRVLNTPLNKNSQMLLLCNQVFILKSFSTDKVIIQNGYTDYVLCKCLPYVFCFCKRSCY